MEVLDDGDVNIEMVNHVDDDKFDEVDVLDDETLPLMGNILGGGSCISNFMDRIYGDGDRLNCFPRILPPFLFLMLFVIVPGFVACIYSGSVVGIVMLGIIIFMMILYFLGYLYRNCYMY